MDHEWFHTRPCPHGNGVYTKKHFKKGEELYRFEGKRVKELTIIEPGDEGYYLQVSVDEYVDTIFPGRFTCHSCEPNAGLKDEVTLVALTDIPANTEIVFDYSTCMLENDWTLKCHCGADNCRGTILDFDQIPEKLQQHYCDLGVVPEWLLTAAKHRLK